MSSKWTSRKFWVSVVGAVAGIATTIWGASAGESVQTIAGAVITVLTVLGYLTAEAIVDAKAVNSKK